jgi:hypothetical protein
MKILILFSLISIYYSLPLSKNGGGLAGGLVGAVDNIITGGNS